MSISEDVRQLEDDLAAMTEERDDLHQQIADRGAANDDLITKIEEHIIKLQDEDVKNSTQIHAETIALLREVKE